MIASILLALITLALLAWDLLDRWLAQREAARNRRDAAVLGRCA